MLENPGKALRKLLTEPGILVAPGAYDGLSARLIAKAGFKAAYLTGAGSSAALLGQPDIGLLTMSEVACHAANICSAVDIPVIADADTGYGNALNVIRTVREFERAGVAAIQLEDQVMPKRCGHLSGKQVVPAEEFTAKLRAAVNGRSNPDLVIIARTDARAVEGFDEAIERCKRYIDTGVDVIFFEAPQSVREVEEVARRLSPHVNLMANMVAGGRTPSLTAKELEEMGYKIVIFPSACVLAACAAIAEALANLKEKGTDQGLVKGMGSLDLFYLLGLEAWLELDQRYQAEGIPTAALTSTE